MVKRVGMSQDLHTVKAAFQEYCLMEKDAGRMAKSCIQNRKML